MSIANELSSEVAVAVLAEPNNAHQNSGNLSAIVLEFHSTIQRLTAEARRLRRDSRKPPTSNVNAAASGSH